MNDTYADSVESKYNGSWEVELNFDTRPGENSSLVVVESDEPPVVSPVGENIMSYIERNDYDLLKAFVGYGEDAIHSISPPDSLDFSFAHLVPKNVDLQWDGEEPSNSYYRWGSDSFLSPSMPWATSIFYD